MAGLSKYRLYFICAFRARMAYRLSALTGIVSSLFHFLVELVLWKTLLGAGMRFGTSMRDMAAYIMINELVLSLTRSDMANTLGDEIRDGSVSMHLIRPFSFRLYLLSSMLGENSYQVLKNFIPVFITGCILVGFPLPPSLPYFFMFTVLLVLGISIMFQIIFISALLAFWTQATWFLSWYVRAGVFFSAGPWCPSGFTRPFCRTSADTFPSVISPLRPLIFTWERLPLVRRGLPSPLPCSGVSSSAPGRRPSGHWLGGN